MSLICSNCQTQLPDDAAFCHKCGTAISSTPTIATEEEPKLDEYTQQQAIFRELLDEAHEHSKEFLDIDQRRKFFHYRAKLWAEYIRLSFNSRIHWAILLYSLRADKPERLDHFTKRINQIKDWFPVEKKLIKILQPYTYEALFIETVFQGFIDEAKSRGYIQADRFTKEGLDIMGYVGVSDTSEVPEEVVKVVYPDFTTIRAIADKDKELFPEPELRRVEAAGAIMRFTTWEAVLVVTMDCLYEGEVLTITVDDEASQTELRKKQGDIATVIKRNYQDTSISVAIFHHIPLVTDSHRYLCKPETNINCTISYSSSSQIAPEDALTLSKTVTLTRGEVIYIDWRGKYQKIDNAFPSIVF